MVVTNSPVIPTIEAVPSKGYAVSEGARLLEVEILAATYYDYRHIGGSSGVTLYCRGPDTGEIRYGNVSAAQVLYSLAREAPKAYSEATVNAPPGGTASVHIKFQEPYPRLSLVANDWERFRPI